MVQAFTPFRVKDKWLVQNTVPYNTEEEARKLCERIEEYENIVNSINNRIDDVKNQIKKLKEQEKVNLSNGTEPISIRISISEATHEIESLERIKTGK